MERTVPSRREFLHAAAGLAFSRQLADGSRAGDERTIEGIRFCWCPPGTFLMGSPPAEWQRSEDERQREVTITKAFYLGVHPVTQGQWKAVVGRKPPSQPLPRW